MTVLRSDLRNTRQSARELRFEPTGSITATNVQTAIQQAASQPIALVPTSVAFAASPYAVKATDTFLSVDTSGGIVVIDLQAEALRLGVPLTIKDVTGHAAANPMSIVPSGAETVDGLAPYPITGDFGGVTVAADFVTTTDGSNFQTTAVSGTVDLGSSGAPLKLDTGTIAIDTWYAVYAIAKADGTLPGFLASTSFTSPTLPSGYTLFARVGAVQTIHATATLYGSWQFGRKFRYVVGLASTAALPKMADGGTGSFTVPTWISVAVARFVPTTAASIVGMMNCIDAGTGISAGMAAPNNSYGAYVSETNPPPVLQYDTESSSSVSFNHNVPFEFMLESSNIYWVGYDSHTHLFCTGWEDNI